MLKTLDLFAGAGGLSFGFEETGEFIIIAAAECDRSARETYKENHKGRNDIVMIPDVVGYDFKSLAHKLNGIDVVIGGPPCQGFSNANRQKNHIISMNNSLVKEYFRAVREIRPKAFVMENVSMLSSSTHMFYDSYRDHDAVVEMGVQMTEKELVLSDGDYNGFVLINIIQEGMVQEYRISDGLYQLLNVLYKNKNNNTRLENYVKCKADEIIQVVENENETVKGHFILLDRIVTALRTRPEEIMFDELAQFLKFQKTFRLKDELDANEIIYQLQYNHNTGKIIARVNSYSVIEYVSKILGNDYVTNSNVLNALWFGVPQDRKRFIMVGVRADLAKNNIIYMPQEANGKSLTVGDAINDLSEYPVNDSNSCSELIPYRENQTDVSDYATEMRRGSSGIRNHIVSKSGEKAKARFAALKEGQNFHDLDKTLKDNYAVPERTQNSIYLRLDRNKPSGTVINVRKSMWIHPTINRAISVREAARLQSFPDRFVFNGTKNEQYQQVGNAVPPLMAKGIAESLLKNIQ